MADTKSYLAGKILSSMSRASSYLCIKMGLCLFNLKLVKFMNCKSFNFLNYNRKGLTKLLLIMKLTVAILFISNLHVFAVGHGQKVTISEKNIPIGKVFKELNRKTGHQFFYQDELVKDRGNMFSQSATSVLTPSAVIPPLPPPIEVNGTVADANGKPLAGASIKMKDQEKGTIADAHGRFHIQLPEKGGTLVVSHIGYQSKEIEVTQSGSISIVLLDAETVIADEIVVVGYGTQKKINLTGAVSTVSAKDFSNRPVTGTVNALQGKMAGVVVLTDNGQPGRDAGTIRIRGIGAGIGSADVRASANPMVIVDGVPGSLSDVNPNDIETISVLKDAASSAIYGARASNGAILVTTKKGKKGGLQIRYDMYAGTQKITRKPDFLPAWQQAELYNEARKNEGAALKWTENDIKLFKDGSDKTGAHPNTDWLSLLYTELGLQQNHNLSINGGDAKTRYMFSLGCFGQQGNVKKVKFERYNALFNINSQFNKKLGMTAGIGFVYAPFQEPISSYATSFGQIIRQINRISNTVPYKWENGAYGYVSDGSPMAWLESASLNKWQNYTVNGNIGADWSPLQGLHLKPSFGYRLSIGQQQRYVDDIQYYKGGAAGTPLTPTKYQGPNNLTNATDRTTYTLAQMLAEYEKHIQNHQFKILLGASQEYSMYNYFSAYRQNFLNHALTQITVAPKSGQQTDGHATDWALQSAFGRINYSFSDKYLLEVNFRFDGSSRFAPGHRWGAFPSASAGWVISKEGFFEQAKQTINLLKLRASWGKLGNQQIANNYPYFESIAGGKVYSFNQTLVTGVAPEAGANQNLSWEKTESYGVGLDMAFLQNKLSVSLDYFVRKTENPLMTAQVGAPYAFKAPYVNVDGGLLNKGMEVTIGYRNHVGEFNYDVSGNLTYVENKVTKLTGGRVISGSTFYDVGYPLQSLYGYEALGIYQTADEVKGSPVLNSKVAPGDIKYKDQNGDGKINAEDKVYLGTFFPKINYGITLNGSWRNFDISIFLQGAAAVKAMGGNLIGAVGSDVQKPTSVFLDRWTPENHTTKFPRLWYSNQQNDPNSNPSSFWVKDASYVRLKQFTVGYNLPQTFIKKIGISNVKVFYSGQNLLTFTKFYKWIDPEIGSSASVYSYPKVLVNSFGLNVTF